MPVAPEHRGPYRQITHKLRWTKDAPPRHNTLSERPRNEKTGAYLDSDEAPTLVSFAADDAVNVPYLLALGAIVPYKPPAKALPKEAATDVR